MDAIKNDPKYRNFTVIRGIEYDTKDAGHILVILPDGIYPRVLRIRGLKCSTLIKLVHSLGGILDRLIHLEWRHPVLWDSRK